MMAARGEVRSTREGRSSETSPSGDGARQPSRPRADAAASQPWRVVRRVYRAAVAYHAGGSTGAHVLSTTMRRASYGQRTHSVRVVVRARSPRPLTLSGRSGSSDAHGGGEAPEPAPASRPAQPPPAPRASTTSRACCGCMAADDAYAAGQLLLDPRQRARASRPGSWQSRGEPSAWSLRTPPCSASEPQAARTRLARHRELLPGRHGGMTRGSSRQHRRAPQAKDLRVSHGGALSRKISAGHGWCTAIRAAFWPSNTAQTSPVQVLARPQQKPRGLRGVREPPEGGDGGDGVASAS